MASQFAADEVRCVAIAPGLMQTEAAQRGVEADNWERIKGMQAVKRQGTTEDIANLAFFLASEEGSFINNQVLLCDGGNQLRGFRM
jgi:3-oxoacyl-[acyl-carrier protein] reductase